MYIYNIYNPQESLETPHKCLPGFPWEKGAPHPIESQPRWVGPCLGGGVAAFARKPLSLSLGMPIFV